METAFDWKKFQFITIVQTTIINNAINLSQEEDGKKRREIFSATGTLIVMDQLFHAAENIPKDMTAYEAANEFCTFFLKNLRDLEIKAGSEVTLPHWCARWA